MSCSMDQGKLCDIIINRGIFFLRNIFLIGLTSWPCICLVDLHHIMHYLGTSVDDSFLFFSVAAVFSHSSCAFLAASVRSGDRGVDTLHFCPNGSTNWPYLRYRKTIRRISVMFTDACFQIPHQTHDQQKMSQYLSPQNMSATAMVTFTCSGEAAAAFAAATAASQSATLRWSVTGLPPKVWGEELFPYSGKSSERKRIVPRIWSGDEERLGINDKLMLYGP